MNFREFRNYPTLSAPVEHALSEIDDNGSYNFAQGRLSVLPRLYQGKIAREYARLYHIKRRQRLYHANKWLRKVTDLMSSTLNTAVDMNRLANPDSLKKYADELARESLRKVLDVGDTMPEDASYFERLVKAFQVLVRFVNDHDMVHPLQAVKKRKIPQEEIESAVLKMKCEKWWLRKLKRLRLHKLEALEIALGNVGRETSAYSSEFAQNEFTAMRQSGQKWLEMMDLVNEHGDIIPMEAAANAGVSNPVNRRNELMLRIRETEEIATEMGYISVFFTITCPSRMHRNSPNWDGTTPKEANNYLVEHWAGCRLHLNSGHYKPSGRFVRGEPVPYFGVRTVEPHADGCPHWHMLLFFPKEHLRQITSIMRQNFTVVDRGELTARRAQKKERFAAYKKARQIWGLKKSKGIHTKEPRKPKDVFRPRFDYEIIDPNKGSAAAYIAKYISKNIDGHQLENHEDEETGKELQQQVNPVLAWASTWNIRQFQFQGSPSVTVYRELRRIREPVKEEGLEEIRSVADEGQWKEFVKLMGGMNIGRDARFKTHYEVTPTANDYAEASKEIKGVLDTETNQTLLTRLFSWSRRRRDHLSWTCGNNCNQDEEPPEKLSRLGIDAFGWKILKGGARLKTFAGLFKINNNQLINVGADYG
ncbi:replication endonuclease [Algicola sagamiensis]|uniref:replication endonuclease n=1 Tax=Algicola sagamiensis TaxID=163869 RepID=UPI00037EC3B8|nr:replication endonuclease [Algicola sagamiensis]